MCTKCKLFSALEVRLKELETRLRSHIALWPLAVIQQSHNVHHQPVKEESQKLMMSELHTGNF